MTEGELTSECLKLLRAELIGYVILKLSDRFTSGVPDVSIDGCLRHMWLEFKTGDRVKWENELQRLTCMRLERAGSCWIVMYEEVRMIRRTCIIRPSFVMESGKFTPHAFKVGFDHTFVLDFVKRMPHQP